MWYPEGDGPFPLVLIVHGNHDPLDYSDPGYGYLGELLASRGFILVSVDENFINGGLRGESDGRAWLLLKHLEDWKHWNDSTAGPFSHKVDMNNIAIMGHSRGGEAVGIAAAFNRLSHYPDDANVKFNFNFDIKSVFAIAPVDGQYKPAGVFTPIENVNYMVIHGSHDGDVSSFNGLRAFQRIRFTDGKPWFKAAWYVYRANHGQWNTRVGQQGQRPAQRALPRPARPDHAGRTAAVQQGRRSAAFLEATLHGKTEYLPMFRDHRARRRVAAEDDVHHALPGERVQVARDVRRRRRRDDRVRAGACTFSGDSLATWKENALNLRSGQNDPLNTNAVTLGWNNHIRGDDTTKLGKPASYTISLSDSLVGVCTVGREVGDLPVARADRRQARSARAGARHDEEGRQHEEGRKEAARQEARRESRQGHDARRSHASRSTTRPATSRACRSAASACRAGRSRFTSCAAHDEEQQRYPTQYEMVLQTYVLPLADFAQASPQFDPTHLRSIRLVFDRLVAGTVVVDDIGVSATAGPFLSARRAVANPDARNRRC